MKQENDHKIKKQNAPLNNYARFSSLALQMLGIIVVGTFIGIKLDENYPNDKRWFTLGLSLFSVIAAIVYVIRRINADSK